MARFDQTLHNIDVRELTDEERELKIQEGLHNVYKALCEKGYNPSAQIVGYILTEDPTYITSHNDARKIMNRMDRYEVLEVLLKNYFEDTNKEG